MLGRHHCFSTVNPPGDGFASDAIRRSTPSAIWKAELRATAHSPAFTRRITDHFLELEIHHRHTGTRPIQNIQRSSFAIRQSLFNRRLRHFDRFSWPRVSRRGRERIVDLGPGWPSAAQQFNLLLPIPALLRRHPGPLSSMRIYRVIPNGPYPAAHC